MLIPRIRRGGTFNISQAFQLSSPQPLPTRGRKKTISCSTEIQRYGLLPLPTHLPYPFGKGTHTRAHTHRETKKMCDEEGAASSRKQRTKWELGWHRTFVVATALGTAPR